MSRVQVSSLVNMMGVAQLVERRKNVIIMGLVNSFILVRVILRKSHIQRNNFYNVFGLTLKVTCSNMKSYPDKGE